MMAIRIYLLEAFVLLWLIGTPLSLLFAWWFWRRARSEFHPVPWRRIVLLLGLLASSANVLVYGGYLLYWSMHQLDAELWKARNLGGDMGGFLCLAAFVGAAAGEGSG